VKPRVARKYQQWPDVPDMRRRIMSAIRSRDTGPELVVRRIVHREGYRFLVSYRVAGFRPDLVFTRRRKVVFVHGCFWHGHGCVQNPPPRTRMDYWQAKFAGNQARDERARDALLDAGWDVLTVWECETREGVVLSRRLCDFLGPPRWQA
jgi:DNA mismatch endonuclease (patch repair protein)